MLRLTVALGLGIALAACGRPPARVVLLVRDGCADSETMRANLEAALRGLHRQVDYRVIDQATLARSDPRSAYPTPTVLCADRDLFGLREPVAPFPEPT